MSTNRNILTAKPCSSPSKLSSLCGKRQSDHQVSEFSSLDVNSRTNNNNNNSSMHALDDVLVEISPTNHQTTRLDSLLNLDTTHKMEKGLTAVLQKNRLTIPTPIQSHAIPLLLKEFDVMASAQTGSGKTLMFLLPIVHRLLSISKPQKHVGKNLGTPITALVVNPTRELAMQTVSVLQNLLQFSNKSIKVVLATGGVSTSQQRKDLLQIQQQKKTCNVILVGTPGRIIQFVDERVISLSSTIDVVIDEADRMLDLGFEPQLQRIARALATKRNSERSMDTSNSQQQSFNRRSVLCSATFPLEVQRIASEYLKPNYYFVAVGKVGGTHERIHQKIVWINGGISQRIERTVQEVSSFLQQPLKNKENTKPRTIVFCNTKDHAEKVYSSLTKAAESSGKKKKGNSSPFAVRLVTGDKVQSDRTKALEEFRSGTIQVLVATDVAARGLDVPDVSLVVQVDAPRDVDTFVHRVGRTGRAGATGRAITLLDGRSIGISSDLVKLLHDADQQIPSWLIGMSHVSRARRLDEEESIYADVGDLQTTTPPYQQDTQVGSNQDSDATHEHEFIGQDFRRTAEAGSWGSKRDTSYDSFEEDAYRSLDEIDVSILDGMKSSPNLMDSDATDLNDQQTSVVANYSRVDSSGTETFTDGDTFTKMLPSSKLKALLKRISGSDAIGAEPVPKILSSLSSMKEDGPLLRFEYLGLFPFDRVEKLLRKSSRGNNANSSIGSACRNGQMPRLLMVAEKPSIAEAIANALSGPSGPRKRRGISRALPVFEFTTDKFCPYDPDDALSTKRKPQKCVALVTSVVGHVFSLGFDYRDRDNDSNGDGQQKWENRRRYTRPIDFFHLPVVKEEEGSTGKLRVVDHLRALAGECDHLVLWLDCDAEGENIAHEVIGITRRPLEQKVAQELATTSSSMADDKSERRIHRARFSAITKDAIRDAFATLIEPDAALSRSVDARQELDLRVGVAMTRLLNWRCVGLARKHFSPSTKLISYGPCQTPALSFCVDRAREIESFQRKEYWKVQTQVESLSDSKSRRQYTPRWKVPKGTPLVKSVVRKHLHKDRTDDCFEESATFDYRIANEAVHAIKKGDVVLKVTRVASSTDSMKPPLGLNTVGLLTAGSKAMGMSPKQTMNVAEKLYSAGFISYPRTETTKYDPNGFDVRSVLREHMSHPEWGRTASYLLRTKYAKSSRPPLHGYDAGDHPPITTLKAATRDEIGGGAAWRVYDFISRNFLGSLGDELVFTRRVAKLEIEPNGAGSSDEIVSPIFELEETVVNTLGFAGACRWVLRDIGAKEQNNKDGPRMFEHDLEVGKTFKVSRADSEKCFTRPPQFLQEHELIEQMDRNRIGTDASMATHVNNIVDRQYVVLCDETGLPLRPPRPPQPGVPKRPRQIGRYLVPTSLGIGVHDLFVRSSEEQGFKDASIEDRDSPALLARPSIRARMEAEVKQIALGNLDKSECVEKNLSWFEARYKEFEFSLSRHCLNQFASDLQPIKQSLGYWRRLGAFEQVQQPKQGKQKRGPRGNDGSRNFVRKDKQSMRSKHKVRRKADKGGSGNSTIGRSQFKKKTVKSSRYV